VVFDAAGQSSFGQCKRLLKPAGIYMSTGAGPWYQNLLLPLATPLLGGRKVVDAYRYVETGQKIGNVVIIVDPPH
jgi:spermidine synthase